MPWLLVRLATARLSVTSVVGTLQRDTRVSSEAAVRNGLECRPRVLFRSELPLSCATHWSMQSAQLWPRTLKWRCWRMSSRHWCPSSHRSRESLSSSITQMSVWTTATAHSKICLWRPSSKNGWSEKRHIRFKARQDHWKDNEDNADSGHGCQKPGDGGALQSGEIICDDGRANRNLGPKDTLLPTDPRAQFPQDVDVWLDTDDGIGSMDFEQVRCKLDAWRTKFWTPRIKQECFPSSDGRRNRFGSASLKEVTFFALTQDTSDVIGVGEHARAEAGGLERLQDKRSEGVAHCAIPEQSGEPKPLWYNGRNV